MKDAHIKRNRRRLPAARSVRIQVELASRAPSTSASSLAVDQG